MNEIKLLTPSNKNVALPWWVPYETDRHGAPRPILWYTTRVFASVHSNFALMKLLKNELRTEQFQKCKGKIQKSFNYEQ